MTGYLVLHQCRALSVHPRLTNLDVTCKADMVTENKVKFKLLVSNKIKSNNTPHFS